MLCSVIISATALGCLTYTLMTSYLLVIIIKFIVVQFFF